MITASVGDPVKNATTTKTTSIYHSAFYQEREKMVDKGGKRGGSTERSPVIMTNEEEMKTRRTRLNLMSPPRLGDWLNETF